MFLLALFIDCKLYCLDAQVCSLSWVSFGLEPASDGSGRHTHLLRRDGSRTTTTPSAPTVTSGTEAGRTCGRPGAAWPAPCGRPTPDGPGRSAPTHARASTYPPVADHPAFAGSLPGVSSPLHPSASRPRSSPGRGHVTLIAGPAISPATGGPVARFLRRPSGRGRSSTAGDCHLTVSGPVGPAVLATATRAEARVLGAAWPSIAGDCHLAAGRPASHTALFTLPGRRRAAPSVDCSLPLPADRTVAPVCSHRARARSRAGSETVYSPPASRPALVRVPCTHRTSGGHATTPIGSSFPPHAGQLADSFRLHHARGQGPAGGGQSVITKPVWANQGFSSYMDFLGIPSRSPHCADTSQIQCLK